ncbi:unnamed protein product [Lupinus luteus]|uniref:Uncharacterized protein n=1 Tax=Lupinus luteus TaxID=3873 RepID=A0AAV1WAY9_LUPLU
MFEMIVRFVNKAITAVLESIEIIALIGISTHMGRDSVVVDGEINGGARRRGCTIQANDFFPEESFKSWDNYGKAFLETP